jgi:hypothetical protein
MILIMIYDFEKTINLKLFFLGFEQLIGLKIIFHKSDFFCFGEAQNMAAQYVELRL